MPTKSKSFEERKSTIGISLTNRILHDLDELCATSGWNRSMVIESLLAAHLAEIQNAINPDEEVDPDEEH